ncbi:MAG: hypothetical protein ACFBWO_03895 [Paracoccaceae bacterium]
MTRLEAANVPAAILAAVIALGAVWEAQADGPSFRERQSLAKAIAEAKAEERDRRPEVEAEAQAPGFFERLFGAAGSGEAVFVTKDGETVSAARRD